MDCEEFKVANSHSIDLNDIQNRRGDGAGTQLSFW